MVVRSEDAVTDLPRTRPLGCQCDLWPRGYHRGGCPGELVATLLAERDDLVARLAAAEKHIARHWPARGSMIGDMTKREELEHDVCEAAKEWRPSQFFVADLVEAVDALVAFEARQGNVKP